MFLRTNSGMLNLDHVVLVEINQQFLLSRDDGYELRAITTNIYESNRQPNDLRRQEYVAPKPAEISPYSVQIIEGTLEDCQNVFDKIAERDNFIKITINEYLSLLNLKHIVSVDINESPNGQNDSLKITVNTFHSDSSKNRQNISESCHFPILSPYELRLSNDNGHNYKEIIEAIEKFGIL